MKEKICKIINVLFVFGIIIYLIASLIRSIIKPKDIIENENRYAEKYTDFSIYNYINKNVQDNIEKVLSDQLIFSGRLRSLNNISKAYMVRNYTNIGLEDNDLEYLNYGGIALYGKENLIYYYMQLDDLKDNYYNKAINYNSLIEKYKDLDIYFYYIEKDTDINFSSNEKMGIYEYLKQILNTNNISKFEINSFDEFKEYFYKTDHHWNYKGSYKGYEEVLKLLNNSDQPLEGEEVNLNIKWSGSKANGSTFRGVMTDDFIAYKFDFPNMKIFVNGVEANYGQQEEYLSKILTDDISYGAFYGWDTGEIIFDTEDESKENIMVIGESHDNAILKLLASHYGKTISIDLRNYKYYMGKNFNFDEYIKKYNISKVLFIGSVNFYAMSEFIIEGVE